jgi:hypothetical protein
LAPETVSRKTSRPQQQNYSSRPLSLSGEFFENVNIPADLQIFEENFREHMQELRPTSTAHHIKPSMFILKDLYTSSHAFLRTDAVKSPLQPP